MANEQHVRWLQKGVEFWNRKRENHKFVPDFYEANLHSVLMGSSCLKDADFEGGDFRNANLFTLDLRKANLQEAWFSGAGLVESDLSKAELKDADFSEADLRSAKLKHVKAEALKDLGGSAAICLVMYVSPKSLHVSSQVV